MNLFRKFFSQTNNKQNHQLIIDGNSFTDIEGFYDEVEKKFTKNLDWKIGRNFDALNDVLQGGFGVFEYQQAIEIHWQHSEKSKKDLSFQASIARLEKNLARCHPSNRESIQQKIAKAKRGEGKDLFHEIIALMQKHEHISLILD